MRKGDKGKKVLGLILIVLLILMFVGSIFSGVVAATTYDPQAAVNYADTWWNGRNPNYHAYSSEGGNCATLQWNSVSNSNADKYLYDMGIATGQSVGYYEPNQTQLDSTHHNIEAPNQLPTAIIDSITTDPAEQGTDTVSFTGHGTDPDGTVVAYNWSSSIDGLLSTSAAFTKQASELSVGTHTIYFKVQDDDGTWSTEDTADLTIYPGPELSYSPESHDFCDMRECETDNTTFEIWNSGTDTLTYSLSETCDWLEVHPTSGYSTVEHNSITVDIDTTGLSEGTHTCDITINSNDGTGTFTVMVNVVDCPESSWRYKVCKWTYMVYLDGDNNLEGAGIDDFMEMSLVGSTSDVNIVVQFDRIPGHDTSYGDWTGCKRFHVTYGMTPMPANALIDLGECNMGDPNTLRDFVEWSMTEYPAENYALVLWNHGSGWKLSVPWMETKGICWDSTSNDHLTLQETGQALSGKYLELLGNDACLMQMIEVAYQMRTSAGIIVGSEETEPWDGWPHDTILSDLTGTPTMSPSTFGGTIVSRYIEYYPAETLSAMNNGDLPGLATAEDNFAQVLIGKLPGNYNEIEQARTNVQVFYDYDYIDLYHFAELIKSSVPGTESAAQAVMDNVDTVVYANAHGSAYQNAHGLTVYYPKNEWSYWTSYENTDFAINTNWDEFLMKYYEGPELVCEGTDTSCGIYPNCENCNDTDGCYAYGDGCEERDYYCESNEAGCNYTYSNRHNDGWEDTCTTRWVDDPENECKEKEQKEQKYWDYMCSDGTCTYSVTDMQWLDTGNTQNKPDGTICGCTASNTLKRCYSGVCTDTGVCNSTICNADVACDGKEPGDSCGGGICDSNCKCGGPTVGEDIAVFRNGIWYVDTNGDCVPDLYYWYGAADYIPLVGDINNDGLNDKILFKDGMWYVDTNGDCVVDQYIWYGAADYIPLVGDINNDGLNDKILFKDGMWYVDTNGDCVVDQYIWYGAVDYIPLVGDINNDGLNDKILFKDGMWYVDTNGDCVVDQYLWYGAAVFTPLVGDINNDGKDDKILFKDGLWYVDTNGDCVIDLYIWYGAADYIPLVGDMG